jgi:hypothetical protein
MMAPYDVPKRVRDLLTSDVCTFGAYNVDYID